MGSVALMASAVRVRSRRIRVGLGAARISPTRSWVSDSSFDLVWIALAAGAFASAGLIYVFQRKDLYALGARARLNRPEELLLVTVR
jgi:formate dehydrogenase iron-sulfur subunit